MLCSPNRPALGSQDLQRSGQGTGVLLLRKSAPPPLGLPWGWYPLLLADPNAEAMTSGPQEAREGLSALSTASHLSATPKHTPPHTGACETSVHAVTCLKCPC